MFLIKNMFSACRTALAAMLLAGLIMSSGIAVADRQKIMVYGDSLVAGYGLEAGESFPEQLQAALVAANIAVDVVNAGVSGDTTAGGLARLDWALADRPDAVIIVLGGNDLLRGLDPQQSRQNLSQILARFQQEQIAVLLCGMLAPLNLGPEYRRQFDAIYPELAEEFATLYYPFFLEGVALDPALNLPDGMHPNRQGIAKITDAILPLVLELLKTEQGAANQNRL